MKNKQYLCSGLILLIVFFYMYYCNYHIPLFADDYDYSFNWSNGNLLSSFKDVIDSQIYHYQHWAGRIVGISLTQLFLFIGKDVFNLLNAFMFIILTLLIYWHAEGEFTLKFQPEKLILIIGLAWLGIWTFGEVLLWLCGSCVYLWPMVFILIFLLPYRIKLANSFAFSNYNSSLKNIGMSIVGLIAGCTNENTALSMLLAATLVVYYSYKSKQLESWMVCGLISAYLGYLILILAPGNYQRINQSGHISALFQIYHTLSSMLRITLHQLPLWVFILLLYRRMIQHIGIGGLKKLTDKFQDEVKIGCFFIALSVVNNLVMLASPQFPPRAGFGSTIFLLIGAMTFVKFPWVKEFIFQKKGKMLIAATITLIIIPMAVCTLKDYMILHKESSDRVAYILDQKEMGSIDLVVAPFSVKDRSVMYHVYCSDIEVDETSWKNSSYKRYFGLRSIKLSRE